jgi:hypothetical protein
MSKDSSCQIKRPRLHLKLVSLFSVFVLLVLMTAGCRSAPTLQSEIAKIVAPDQFSISRWEISSLSRVIDESIDRKYHVTSEDSQVVVDYFAIMDKINSETSSIEAITSGVMTGDLAAHLQTIDDLEAQRDNLTGKAEAVLESQLRATLVEAGIYNPLNGVLNLTSTFPPVELTLQEPPKLLVVSPRDKIERLATITLNNNISLDQISQLESSVSSLDVSALVVDLGGIATYPSFVANRYGLQFALSTAAEEWLHQYFFFRPLGFRYGLEELGFSEPDYIVTMNETLAGMVSEEIAGLMYDRYYASFYPTTGGQSGGGTTSGFNFNTFMHETRLQTDSLLAQGKIDEAESYMEQQRLILASHGYLIRKLNQAFFAFYGSYADQPGFENPIADNLNALRAESANLAAFVQQASSLINPDQLAQAVK